MIKWIRTFVGPRSRMKYWSSSKLSKYIQKKFGNFKKPPYATMEDWADWKDDSKQAAPFVYWLTEDFFDDVQDFVYFPYDFLCAVRYYFYNRFVHKTHALTSSTLERGMFHEFETRVLHCLFDDLVRFVEIEKAWMQMICHPEKKPWYAKFYPLRLKPIIRPEYGIEYLNWEATLKEEYWDDEKKETVYTDKPTNQALAATETLALYNWWKFDRAKRIDPYELSGYNEFTKDDVSRGIAAFSSRNAEDRAKMSAIFAKVREIEAQYDAEDEEMLLRLIKIRKSLWT